MSDGGSTRSLGSSVDASTRGVLVLEQDAVCASSWQTALRELCVPVAVTSDPSVALVSAAHAVVVIGSLPAGTTAVDIVRALVAQPGATRPRIVVVTREPLRRVDRVNVDAALERPLRADALVAQVRRLLSLSRPARPRRDSPRRLPWSR